MRLLLFTDTLNDVNGVSRFIRNVAEQALAARERGEDLDLHVITSTRLPAPPSGDAEGERPNLHNVPPLYARPMPGYPQLELAIPRRGEMWRVADALAPDVVHVSTPGPVGTLGRRYARRRGLPLLGTYHTDFPAYIDHLFAEPAYTWVCTQAMRHFYGPFDRIFTRSADYGHALQRLGIGAERIVRLLPGIDTGVFDAKYKDATGAIWDRLAPIGVRRGSVKVLYVGRVSVEKNLPLLTKVWPGARARCAAKGVDAQLLVVGDGPYKKPMQEALAARVEEPLYSKRLGEPLYPGAVFLGFRHGVELSTIYASADLFAFPSLTDTLGQVVMESQCVGLPVIVTNQGGPSEVVDDEVSGFVLPGEGPGAIASWQETIERLACDVPLRAKMGEAGKRKMAPMTIRHSFEHFWSVHEEAAAAATA